MPALTAALLAYISRVFKLDAAYWAKNGFWLVSRRIVSMATVFLVAVAFANLLPKEVYGTYKYLLSVFAVLSAFTLSGMNAAVEQSIARGFEGSLREGYRIKRTWNLVASAVALGVASYYVLQANYAFAAAYAAFAVLFPLWDASMLFDEYVRAKENFKRSATLDMVQQTGVSIALIVGVLALPNTPLTLALIYLAVQTAFSAYFYKKIAKQIPASAADDPGTVRYAGHLSVINVVGAVANQIENILLFRLLGPAQLAVYAFATAIPEQMKGVLANIGTMAFPRFAKRDLASSRRSLIAKIPLLALIGVAAVGSYLLVAPFIYRTFFPAYLESVSYSQVFALSLLNMVIAPSAVILQAHKKTREQYASNLISSFSRIVIVTVFLSVWGIWGLVFARILTRFGGSALDFLLLLKSR